MNPSFFKSPTPDFQNEYYYQYEESLGDSSTSSKTFQNKVTLTTPVIPAGNYRIGWSYTYSNEGADRECSQQVTVDAVRIWVVNPEMGRANNYRPGGSFAVVNFASAAAHTITLDYRRVDATTTHIRYAKIEIWRID